MLDARPLEARSLIAPDADAAGTHTSGSRADIVELRAAMLYESGFWCGESVLKAVNEIAGSPMPPEVTKLASGFCEGFGGSRCTCGALAGAVMAAGIFSGRESASDPWEPVYDAAAELRQRFVVAECATSCDEIVRRIGAMHRPERWAHCAELVGKCARWVVEIAEQEGWLPEEA